MSRKHQPSPPPSPERKKKQAILTLPDHVSSLPIVRPEPGKKIVPIRTQARAATILPNFVGLKFQVYNGKVYHDVTITEDMVGHKLGEFSPLVAPRSVCNLGAKARDWC